MKKLLLLVFMAMLATSSYAQGIKWTNGNGSGLWSDDANWDAGFFPFFAGDETVFEGSTSNANCLVVNDPNPATSTDVPESNDGSRTTGLLTIGTGGVPYGTLTIQNGSSLIVIGSRWTAVGWTNEATLVVEPNATLKTGSHLWLGFNPGAKSFVELYGTIEVGEMFGVNFEGLGNADSEAKLRIYNGGHLKLSQLTGSGASPNNSFNGAIADDSVEILGGGKITLVGDRTGDFNDYVTMGKIATPGGSAVIEYDATEDLTTVTSSAVASVDSFGKLSFEAYPNPSSDIVYISSKSSIAKVTVSNILGQSVLQSKNTATLNIANLKSGVYLVSVEDEDGNSGTRKIIKN